jgi:hypothetical protein
LWAQQSPAAPDLLQHQHQYQPHVVGSGALGGAPPDAAALAVYAAAAPPLNLLEARRSPHGRPPCSFVVFGIAGRAVIQQPSVHSGERARCFLNVHIRTIRHAE